MLLKYITAPGETVPPLPPLCVWAAFFTGCLFVLAPVPQLTVNAASPLALLCTAYISPVCGILLMTLTLLRFAKWEGLQIRKLTKEDILLTVKATAVIVIVYMLINALWKMLLIKLNIPFSENQSLMALAQKISGVEFLLFALLVTVPIPIAEELLFRRLLYAGLLPFGQLFALLGTAGLFAAVHLFLVGLPGLFIIGIGFQLIYLHRKNLLASILSHALLNSCAVIAAAFAKGI